MLAIFFATKRHPRSVFSLHIDYNIISKKMNDIWRIANFKSINLYQLVLSTLTSNSSGDITGGAIHSALCNLPWPSKVNNLSICFLFNLTLFHILLFVNINAYYL